jgi:hypothetical protein
MIRSNGVLSLMLELPKHCRDQGMARPCPSLPLFDIEIAIQLKTLLPFHGNRWLLEIMATLASAILPNERLSELTVASAGLTPAPDRTVVFVLPQHR